MSDPAVTMGDVSDLVRGVTYDKAASRLEPQAGYLPLLRATNINEGQVLFDSFVFVPEEAVSEVQRIRHNDIILAASSGSLSVVGKAALVRKSWSGTFGAFCYVIRPESDLVLPEFLGHFMQSSAYRRRVSELAAGVNIKNLRREHVLGTPVPYVSLAQQRRIVDTLDSMLSRLDASVASLGRAQRTLQAYRASVLKAAVEGRLVPTEAELARKEGRSYEPADVLLERILKERRRRWEETELARMEAAGRMAKDDRWKAKYEQPTAPDASDLPRLPEGWSWATVDQLGEVAGGITKNAAKDTGPKRYTYLRVANVYANRLVLDDVKEIAVDDHELPRLLLQRGDLLVVEGNGSVHQIGRVALWDGSIERAVHQNHLIKVRFRRSPLERWALTWLLSPGGRTAIERVASSTSGLHTLSISKVQRLPVPLPPESEQARLLETLDQLLSIVDANAESVATGLRRCARLRQSVLCWAFEGKLVDQDSADEPADALLSRIRAERSASATARPKPKRARKLKAAS